MININSEWRRDTNYLIGKICKTINNYKLPRCEIYKKLEEKCNCNLEDRLKNLKNEVLKSGVSSAKVKQINILDVIENDDNLRRAYIHTVNEIAIKYGVLR